MALSPREVAILDFIEAHVAEHGYPPSVREIGDAVGYRSKASVHTMLLQLQRQGYIQRVPGRSRAIRVVRP